MTQEEKRAKWREYYYRKHPRKPAITIFHPAMNRLVVRDGYRTSIFWSNTMLQYLMRNYATMLNRELAEWLGVSLRTMIRKARELKLEKDPRWLKGIHRERARMANAATRVKGNPGCFRKGMHASPATEFKKGHIPYNKQQVS